MTSGMLVTPAQGQLSCCIQLTRVRRLIMSIVRVAVWMGHSESVSTKHSTQVRPKNVAAAVGRRTDPQTDPKASENPGTRGTGKTMNPENACVFPGSAVEFAGIRRGEMLRQGFEP